MAKMVDSLVKELDDTGDAEKLLQTNRLLKDEIRQNRLAGLNLSGICMRITLKQLLVLRLKMPFDLFSIMSEIP